MSRLSKLLVCLGVVLGVLMLTAADSTSPIGSGATRVIIQGFSNGQSGVVWSPNQAIVVPPTGFYGPMSCSTPDAGDGGATPAVVCDAGAMLYDGGTTLYDGGHWIDGGASTAVSGTLPVHEQGYKSTVNSTVCVLCSTVGDGGVLAATASSRYVLQVVDQNGSPVQVANGLPCVGFGTTGTGEMIPANIPEDWIPAASPDGSVAVQYTCCAQTATSSPAGPFLCLTPLQ